MTKVLLALRLTPTAWSAFVPQARSPAAAQHPAQIRRAGYVLVVADALFEDARLAALYDVLHPDRSDLDVYAALVIDELRAQSDLDVGCGTGTFACLLAERGVEVTAVDPARASLQVAKAKPGADRVSWLLADATALPPLSVSVATMTGNVAQVFVTDDGWTATLRGVREALQPGGFLVFETRDPADQAWLRWNRKDSHRQVSVPGHGAVEAWEEVTAVHDALVSFRSTLILGGGTVLTSDSTLRFRSRHEIEASLTAAGFATTAVRDAPDRPGRELVFIAERLPPRGR